MTRRYNILASFSGIVISNRDILIRVDSTSVEFPRICPVCGFEATKHRYISRTKKNGGKDSISVKRKYNPWLPPLPPPSTRFSMGILVCEKHYKSSAELQKNRSMTAIVAGLSAPTVLLLGVILAFSWYDRIALPIGFFVITFLSLVVLIWSLRDLGSTDLDRVVSIVDFVQGNPFVIIRVKPGRFADELLVLNQSSKIVRRKKSSPM